MTNVISSIFNKSWNRYLRKLLEENIESIVRKNDIVDDEIQGIKSDMISLEDKI